MLILRTVWGITTKDLLSQNNHAKSDHRVNDWYGMSVVKINSDLKLITIPRSMIYNKFEDECNQNIRQVISI